MHRRNTRYLGAAACCALLAACFGGGDSPDPTPTPTPTATPTPSPTPTPTPTPVNFGFTQAFTDSISNTSYIYAFFTPNTGGAEVWSDGNTRGGTSTIAYAVSPESVRFTWPDGASLMEFDAADRQTDTPTLRTYRDGMDALSLELPFAHILRVTYERTESFVRDSVPGMLRSNRVTIFFNEVTATSAIASNLSYTGTTQVFGGTSGTTPASAISGEPTTLTVTASNSTIAGTIRIFENVNGTPTLRAALPISATLNSGGGFGGTTTDSTSTFTGNFAGALAGPSREEVFLYFVVTHTDGRKFVGSLIGT